MVGRCESGEENCTPEGVSTPKIEAPSLRAKGGLCIQGIIS